MTTRPSQSLHLPAAALPVILVPRAPAAAAGALWRSAAMNSEYPYESPLSDPGPSVSPPPDSRKNRVAWLSLPPLIGAAIGSLLLARYLRGPGDPYGYYIGAGLGGVIGLVIGIMGRVLARTA